MERIPQLEFKEDDIAMQLAKWMCLKGLFFTHVANEGKRTKQNGAKLKAMGMLPGVSDYLIFEPRGNYHGLAVELKTPKGKPSKAQEAFISRMIEKGYRAKICYGFDDAMKFIEEYING